MPTGDAGQRSRDGVNYSETLCQRRRDGRSKIAGICCQAGSFVAAFGRRFARYESERAFRCA
jgi:hypothetical protein